VFHSQSEEKANILNNQFQKAFSEKTEITDQEFRTRCEMQGNFPTMPDIVFTENSITKQLANLNPYKAAGPDNIMPQNRFILFLFVSSCLFIFGVTMSSI
jgi:hypothetical protein